MIINKEILDGLTAKAKESPRLRCNLDMRNSSDDQSQRMLNALEPGTVMPIHRHKGSSETCICIRGHFEEYFYDKDGNLTETIDMVPGGVILNIEKGQWHSLRCLESGTVLFEAKDGPYEPLGPEDILEPALTTRIRQFMEEEARSCSMDPGCITPEYVYRMWGGKVPLEEIKLAFPARRE